MFRSSDIAAYNRRKNHELQAEIARKFIQWLREQAQKEDV
jgi:hypothetical protein